MTDTSPPLTLLEQLDARQDEVLQQLDELNERIEQLLREHGARLSTAPAWETAAGGAGARGADHQAA